MPPLTTILKCAAPCGPLSRAAMIVTPNITEEGRGVAQQLSSDVKLYLVWSGIFYASRSLAFSALEKLFSFEHLTLRKSLPR